MPTEMLTLEAVLAREAIRDCLARLARGEDRRNAQQIRACFWPEARTDYGIFAGSFDEYLAWVVPGASAIVLTQHVLGQSVIDLEGDHARVETQVTSYHRIDTGTATRDVLVCGRYLDRLACRGGVWRIIERTMLYDWVQDIGASVDWSQGLLGTPFSAAHYIGRVVHDYSESFFAATRNAP